MRNIYGADGWSFTLSSIRHAEHAPEVAFAALPQWSTDLHLIHTIEGEGVLQIGHRRVVADPGAVVVVPVFEPSAWRKAAGHRWAMVNLHVRITDPHGRALHELPLLPERFAPRGIADVHRELERWHRTLAEDDSPRAGPVAIDALSLVGRYLADHCIELPAVDLHHDSRVIDMAAHLRDAAHRPFDIDALADRASIGRSQVDRLFRAAFGVSPKAYWTRHRLGLAQAMLSGTATPIGDIARRLGFSDIYYFSRWFRQQSGVTARAFRQLGREL